MPEKRPQISVKSVLHLGRTMRLVWSIAPGWTLRLDRSRRRPGRPAAGQPLHDPVHRRRRRPRASRRPTSRPPSSEVAWLILIAGLIGLASALARSVGDAGDRGPGPGHHRPHLRPHPRQVDRRRPRVLRELALLRRAAPRAAGGALPAGAHRQRPDDGGAERHHRRRRDRHHLHDPLAASAIIVVAAALPSAYVRFRYSSRMYEWQRRSTIDDRRSWYLHWLLTDGTYAKELRLFDLGEIFRGWYQALRDVLRGQRLSHRRAALVRRPGEPGDRHRGRVRHLRLHRLAHHPGRHLPGRDDEVLPGLQHGPRRRCRACSAASPVSTRTTSS